MKILIVVDKLSSAIDRLAQPIQKYNPHFDIKILAVHPKKANLETLSSAQQLMRWADIIDIHYWKSAIPLKNMFLAEFEAKPKIICHFNPYDIEAEDWLKTYKKVVVGNSTIHNKIPYSHLIPYGIDLGFWKFNSNYTKEKTVNMCAARIEGKKGIREVAQACQELGYQFNLIGRVSDADYMAEVMKAGGQFIKFLENVTDEQARDIYYQSAIHICNSVDNFESGTLPILEAMACGVPVLTRNVGHVPDLFDGGNMVVRNGKEDNVEDLKKELKDLMENEALRLKIREKAWQTVKNRNEKKMARQFSSLYYKVWRDNSPLVSIIIPTFDRGEVLIDCLASASSQDYPFKEIVVVDSGNIKIEKLINKIREQVNLPIKYIYFPNEGKYTLPKARNLGILEAEGEILVFCDDRIQMMPGAIIAFVKQIGNKRWLWGIKDETEKGFVENFSCIKRLELIRLGMFNERIDCYGGTTQEIRIRFEKNDFDFIIIQNAQAKSIAKSHRKWGAKDEIIKSKLLVWKLHGDKDEEV